MNLPDAYRLLLFVVFPSDDFERAEQISEMELPDLEKQDKFVYLTMFDFCGRPPKCQYLNMIRYNCE